jgi:hypothetical protein
MIAENSVIISAMVYNADNLWRNNTMKPAIELK